MTRLSPNTETISHQEQNVLTVDSKRRSARLLLNVTIAVSGKSRDGLDFQEKTQTMVVNAHGALISLATPVTAGQRVTVCHKTTRESCECRIVYFGDTQQGRTHVGIEFVKPSPSFWDVDFPPDDWVIRKH